MAAFGELELLFILTSGHTHIPSRPLSLKLGWITSLPSVLNDHCASSNTNPSATLVKVRAIFVEIE